MNTTLTYLRNLSLTFWLGEMLFFIVIFAPRVFKVLQRPDAAKLQGEIFPAYYMAGIVCGVIFLTSVLVQYFLNRNSSPEWPVIVLALAGFVLIVFVYSYYVLTPEIKALQPLIMLPVEQVNPEHKIAFDKLHKLSVRVNGAALLALLALLKFNNK